MALNPDDTVCFCFHVTFRKVETYCKIEKPQFPSQISECLSAGTGCGWCVPMLQKVHQRCCGQQAPWWRQTANVPAVEPARVDEDLDAEAYKAGRAKYLQDGKGKPPPGAEV